MKLPASIPTAADVIAAMRPMRRAQLMRLAADSKVPYSTLSKLARGNTKDPRLDTVSAIVPHLKAAAACTAQRAPRRPKAPAAEVTA